MRPIAILNPNASGYPQARALFARHDIPFRLSPSRKAGKAIMREIIGDYDTVILCGGDGTYNAFVNHYLSLPVSLRKRHPVAFGFLPGGNANDLTAALNIPKSMSGALDRIMLGDLHKMDVLTVNDSFFLTGGGLGYHAKVVHECQDVLGRERGIALKPIIDLAYSAWMLHALFTVKQGVVDDSGNHFLLVGIFNQERIGKHFYLAPGARNDDGMMEVCFVPHKDGVVEHFVQFFSILRGTHIKRPDVRFERKKSLVIKTRENEVFMGDGEILCEGKEFRVAVDPGAITVVY